jgi:hypothetical protein
MRFSVDAGTKILMCMFKTMTSSFSSQINPTFHFTNYFTSTHAHGRPPKIEGRKAVEKLTPHNE